jgi:hypothetical protein
MGDRPDVEVFDDGLIIASGALTGAVAMMELSKTATEKSWLGSIVWVKPLEKRDLSGQKMAFPWSG